MNIYSQIRNNKIRTYFIISIFIGLITFMFYMIGAYVGDPTLYLMFGVGFSLFSGIGSYFYSDKIVLKMSGARPATKEEFFDFYTIAENLSIASGLPMPKLYVIDDPAPNAFATGRNPEHAVVAATTGILSKLKRGQLEGVIAHELSHVKNYDILVMSIVTVLVGTIAYTVDFVMRGFWFGRGNDNKKGNAIIFAVFILFLVLMPVLATIIQMAVSRRREYLADASGALLTRNPEGLASALETIAGDRHVMKKASNATAHMFISNPLKKKGKNKSMFASLFSTHPPMEERVKILRSM